MTVLSWREESEMDGCLRSSFSSNVVWRFSRRVCSVGRGAVVLVEGEAYSPVPVSDTTGTDGLLLCGSCSTIRLWPSLPSWAEGLLSRGGCGAEGEMLSWSGEAGVAAKADAEAAVATMAATAAILCGASFEIVRRGRGALKS